MNERDYIIQAIKELLPDCNDIELLQLILSMLMDSAGIASPAH